MLTWLKEKVETVILPENHPTVIARRAECASCPQRYAIPMVSRVAGPQCLMCGCFLYAKTRTVKERCPLNFW